MFRPYRARALPCGTYRTDEPAASSVKISASKGSSAASLSCLEPPPITSPGQGGDTIADRV